MNTTSLGILGLGSRSTAFYLSELNRLYNKTHGGYSTCPLFLINTNFNSINTLLPKPSTTLDLMVKQYLNTFETLNTTQLLIPNITLHETIDRLSISQNIIHPIHLSISKIKQNQWPTIVLFGSLYSMQSEYLLKHFKANNIDVITPTPTDMERIDAIRTHIYNETETEALLTSYHALIAKYSKDYPVVLACTELSILKPKKNPRLLDMAQVQIEAAINKMH